MESAVGDCNYLLLQEHLEKKKTLYVRVQLYSWIYCLSLREIRIVIIIKTMPDFSKNMVICNNIIITSVSYSSLLSQSYNWYTKRYTRTSRFYVNLKMRNIWQIDNEEVWLIWYFTDVKHSKNSCGFGLYHEWQKMEFAI